MMMLLMVMPMMVIPLVMMVVVVMMIKMFGANTREQAALRRLLISDPKLPSTRPTICISSALINVFSLSANCISSLLKKIQHDTVVSALHQLHPTFWLSTSKLLIQLNLLYIYIPIDQILLLIPLILYLLWIRQIFPTNCISMPPRIQVSTICCLCPVACTACKSIV